MSETIGIVDYGAGNLLSLARAFHKVGGKVLFVSDPGSLESCDRLVLPGVGTFTAAIIELNRTKMADSIRRYHATGKPLLGICLGFQLLGDFGEEFGSKNGLGLVRGKAMAVPTSKKVPHIGWNGVHFQGTSPLFNELESGSRFYFLHSYCLGLESSEGFHATTEYGGASFAAAYSLGNIYGCQFHPEKSAENGLKFLSNFLTLT